MRKIGKITILLALVVFFSSCSKYEKILKTSDNETKYKLAMQFYEEGKYGRAVTFFDPILMYVRGTERDDSVNFYFAKAHYLDKDPYTSEYYFNLFKQTFPRSPFAEEASFLYAMSLYKQSHRPDLDQIPTIRCLNAINEYTYSFPNGNESRREEAANIKKELFQRLELKSFNAAKLYYTIEDYRSAIVSFKNHLKEYPDSGHREESLFFILKSSYIYAKNSKEEKRRERFQNMLDEYFNFNGEFPESTRKAEADKMYKVAVGVTKFDSSKEREIN